MNTKISLEDVKALRSVISLVNIFSGKVLIKKRGLNLKRLERHLEELETSIHEKDNTTVKRYKRIVKIINNYIQNEINSQIFFIFGVHGGIIIDNIGFCEFDYPKYALDKLLEKMNLALENNMPLNLEIAISCLEILNNNYSKRFSKFKETFHKGKFQIINPTFSLPYNLIIGSESNIKQIELGLKVLAKMGLLCNIYYASESSVHPQLPQILKGFEIELASLRSRLLGMNPTAISGNIEWIGLDNTKIQTIANQSGLFTGEYFHGTFFQEIPNLLFQAVSFPFNDYILYSAIEDSVLSLPYQDEVWKVSNHNEIFGKFVLCSEFLKLTEMAGSFKFKRDSFYLGDYIFLEQKLFYYNKICETLLISLEALNSIFNFDNSIEIERIILNLWKDLLITQNHDAYAVPFIHSGDYSFQQLENNKLGKQPLTRGAISISELCIQILKKVELDCKSLILNLLQSYLKELCQNDGQFPSHLLAINPCPFSNRAIVSIPWNFKDDTNFRLKNQKNELILYNLTDSKIEFIAEVPALGYVIYDLIQSKSVKLKKISNGYWYSVDISSSKKTIQITFKNTYSYDIEFNLEDPYVLNLVDYFENNLKQTYLIQGVFKNQEFTLEIIQYKGINRLEYNLDAKSIKGIVVKPKFNFSESFINYPFGVEKTKRKFIQSLDFLLIRNDNISLLYIQMNSQKFTIDQSSLKFCNEIKGNGFYKFAIILDNEINISKALIHSKSYFFNLYGLVLGEINPSVEKINSFLSVNSPIIIENIWKRAKDQFIRLFNPSNTLQKVKLRGSLIKHPIKEINLKYNELRIVNPQNFEMKAWEIKTIKLDSSKQE